MRVQVTTTPEFSASRPVVMFESHFQKVDEPSYPSYDISLDGRRILMIKPSRAAAASSRVNVVLNWSEELKQRVPVK